MGGSVGRVLAEFACEEVRLSAIVVGESTRSVGKGDVDVTLAVVLQRPLEGDNRAFDAVQRNGEVAVIGEGGSREWGAREAWRRTNNRKPTRPATGEGGRGKTRRVSDERVSMAEATRSARKSILCGAPL